MSTVFHARNQVIPDLNALWLSWLISTYMTGPKLEGLPLLRVLEMRISLANVLLLALAAVLWAILAAALKSYQRTTGFGGLKQELRFVLSVAIMGSLMIAGLALVFHINLFSRDFLTVFFPAYIFLDLTLRGLHRVIMEFLDPDSRHHTHVALLGNGSLATTYEEYFRHSPNHRVVGYFAPEASTTMHAPYLGDESRLDAVLHEMAIDAIVVASSLGVSVHQGLAAAQAEGIHIVYPLQHLEGVLPLPHPLTARVRLNPRSRDMVALTFVSGPQLGWLYYVKRIMDVSAAAIALIALSPLMLAIALSIRLTMGSPVLFVQKRLGYHRRTFDFYKFRTMIPQADAMREQLRQYNERKGAAFKMTHDPRVTPLGRWLRRTSLDELPQLINIVRGDMSLVGPRPLPLDDYAHMDERAYLRRVSVLPGLTGPWQVSDRDRITFDEWMKMELDYIDHWSLRRDLVILFKTVWVVLARRGAK